jgi:hypothetical protein
MNWGINEVVSDWLNYTDSKIIQENENGELWHNSKNFVLDSIEVLDYIRKSTDNISYGLDNRFQKLIDATMQNCRNDYYHRFLKYNGIYYNNIKALWWIDCWQSIRLTNILHELNILTIDAFFDSSDGRPFEEKWVKFFRSAHSEIIGASSLPAYSYLEGIRFLINMGKDIPYVELSNFLTKLCERDANSLKFFRDSNEIRAQALYIIRRVNEKWPRKYDFNDVEINLLSTLEELLLKSEWNEYSNTWAPILIKINDDKIVNLIKPKIPINGFINPRWVNGNNFTKKARYAFLFLFANLRKDKKYFELIEPNRFAYIPSVYIENYKYVGHVVDRVLQSFKDVKDLQKKIQDDDITEGYFRDLLKLGVTAALANNENIQWVEKESPTGSGRITDISITVKNGPEISFEVKILWRFKVGYEPIEEVLEQLNTGNLGITLVINPTGNPCYKSKYQDFDGWKKFVRDHPTYISGTLRDSNNLLEKKVEFKSKHFFSDHSHIFNDREKHITLLNFFVDLRDYNRSPMLSKL